MKAFKHSQRVKINGIFDVECFVPMYGKEDPTAKISSLQNGCTLIRRGAKELCKAQVPTSGEGFQSSGRRRLQ